MAHSGAHQPGETIRYGVHVAPEAELRVLGTVANKRALELGCAYSNAVALAHLGTHVITVDPSAERLARVRAEADAHEVKVETHQGDLADLAFLRADSIDVALSIDTLPEVDDLGRLVRQVHRVLKHDAAFVFAYEHPLAAALSGAEHPYFDAAPRAAERGGEAVTHHPRAIGDVFTTLVRSGFRVDLIAEPRSRSGAADTPVTIIWRARKEGV